MNWRCVFLRVLLCLMGKQNRTAINKLDVFVFSHFHQKLSLHLKFYQFTRIKGLPFGWLDGSKDNACRQFHNPKLELACSDRMSGQTGQKYIILWHQCKYQCTCIMSNQKSIKSQQCQLSTIDFSFYFNFRRLLRSPLGFHEGFLMPCNSQVVTWYIANGHMPLRTSMWVEALRWMKQVSWTCHRNHNG